MKSIKRKAKRISDRPIKKKAINMNKSEKPSADINQNIYSGSEKKMLDIVVKLIKKSSRKRLIYSKLWCSTQKHYDLLLRECFNLMQVVGNQNIVVFKQCKKNRMGVKNTFSL